MIKRMKQQMGIVSLMMGIGTVLVGYFAWGLLTVHHKSGAFGEAGFLFSLLTMLFYTLFCYSVLVLAGKDFRRQLMVISGLGAVLCLLLFLRGGGALFLQGEYGKLCLNILWFANFAGCFLLLGRFRQSLPGDEKSRLVSTDRRGKLLTDEDSGKGLLSGGWKERVMGAAGSHRWLLFLLAVTALLLIEPDAVQFKWDGLLYYLACREGAADSISSLAPYGHIAQTYGMLNCLGRILAGDTAAAMIGMNIILFLCSVCAFYGMIKCMLPGKQDFVYALAAAVYAWSPFTLGMVYYHSLDFYCLCFFVIMLCFLYRRQWIYFFIASMLFCFTKEPAVLIYATTCVSLVVLDFTDQSGAPFWTRVGRMFRTKRYYAMTLPGILWLATYKILGPWSAGVGGLHIDGAYVFEKLKALYILQFNWLFTFFCVGGAAVCILRKERGVWQRLFPILCGQLAFTVFSCIFKTVNHPRYNGTNQPALMCMAIVLSAYALEHLYGQILAGCVAVLMAVSSFCTVDPVTRLSFPQYSAGSTVMITTDTNPLGDGMIYNRQMLWLEHALGAALADSLAGSDTVFFPSLGGNTYYFDGMAEVGAVTGVYYRQQEYWNPDRGRREAVFEDGVQIYTACQLAEEPDWDVVAKDFEGRKNYCYLPCAGEGLAEEIRQRFHVLEEQEYAYRGWKVYRISFE